MCAVVLCHFPQENSVGSRYSRVGNEGVQITVFKTMTVAVALFLAVLAGSASLAQQQYTTIGTGGQTGVYSVVGQSVCRLVNRSLAEHGSKCLAPLTSGSIANLHAIKVGNLDMGVVQSDWQHHAYNGTSEFEGVRFDKLRAVFSVHSETFNVIARKDSGIRTLDDLKGKRINFGNPGSGQRATMEVVMAAKGWTLDDFALVSELRPSEQASALGENKVDAIIYVAGHPNGSIQHAVSIVDAELVSVSGPEIDELVNGNSFYSPAIVPAGMYKGTNTEVATFSVRATFVSSADVDDTKIYRTVKAVFDDLDQFKRLHPAFEDLTAESMIASGLSAPLHEGALRYYKERGWIE